MSKYQDTLAYNYGAETFVVKEVTDSAGAATMRDGPKLGRCVQKRVGPKPNTLNPKP